MLLSRYVLLIEGIRSGTQSVQRNCLLKLFMNKIVFFTIFLYKYHAIVSIAMLDHWKVKASAVCNS